MEKSRTVKVTIERKIPLFEKVCPVCEKTFDGHKLAVYCSLKCRRAAAWKQHGKTWNANRKKAKQGGQGR